MSNWISVGDEEIANISSDEKNGIRFEVFASPFDIPTAVRGEYVKKEKKFRIFFRYLSSFTEPSVISNANHVRFEVGKRSGRIYVAEIDLEKYDADAISLAIRTLDHLPVTHSVSQNTEITKRVIQRHANELLTANEK